MSEETHVLEVALGAPCGDIRVPIGLGAPRVDPSALPPLFDGAGSLDPVAWLLRRKVIASKTLRIHQVFLNEFFFTRFSIVTLF